MPLAYRLEDYAAYQRRVGEATYVDVTRRTDPARAPKIWDNLSQVVSHYGWPWVIQFWTKDIENLIALGRTFFSGWQSASQVQLASTLTAQVTVTGLAGTQWEPKVPPAAFDHVAGLAKVLGSSAHIRWRYDPIIPTVHTPERFRTLATRAVSEGIRHCTINFLAPPGRYKRVDHRLQGLLPGWAEGMPSYDSAWRIETARELVDIARGCGLSIACCAESAGLADKVAGLLPALCGDYAWFSKLSGRQPALGGRRSSRPGCGCAPYFDVGNYGYWSRCHQCAYCYAG